MRREGRIFPRTRPDALPFVQVVEVHDSLQVEIKRDYPVSWADRPGSYLIDQWLFVPRSFGLSPVSMTKDEILAFANTLYRWREDQRVYGDLVSDQDLVSPLAQAEAGLRAFLRSGEGASRPIADQVRRAGGIARAFLQERGLDLRERLDALESRTCGGERSDAAAASALRSDAHVFLDQVERVLARFRDLRRRTQQASHVLHPEVVEAAYLVDEHVTARAEAALARITASLARAPSLQDGAGGRAELEARAAALARDTAQERVRAGFCTVGANAIDAERFAFKQSLLKKYTDRPLYLISRTKRGEEGQKLRHAIGAFAASLGAIWALLAQIFTAQMTVASAVTLIVAVVFVLAYAVKDRLKNIVSELLMRLVRNYIPDRLVTVLDPSRDPSSPRPIARVTESIRFLTRAEVPPEVRAARDLGHTVDVGPERDEDVVLFRRTVDASPSHGQGLAPVIKEIQRLEVSRLLERLDDPTQRFFHWDVQKDSVVERDAPKVYHLNLVFRIVAGPPDAGEEARYARARVILTKRGIARVEEPLPLETVEGIRERVKDVERTEALREVVR